MGDCEDKVYRGFHGMMAYRKIAGWSRVRLNSAGFSRMIASKYGVTRRVKRLPALNFLNTSGLLFNNFMNFVSVYSSEMSTGYVYVNHRRGSGLSVIQDYAFKPIMIYPYMGRTNHFSENPINLPDNYLVSGKLLARNNSLTHNNLPTQNKSITYSNSLTHNNTATYNSLLIHKITQHQLLPEQGPKLTHYQYKIFPGRTTLVAATYGRVARQSKTMRVFNLASLNCVSVCSSKISTGYVPVNLGRCSGYGVIKNYTAKTFMVYPHLRRTEYYPGYIANFSDNSLVHENIITHNNSLIYNYNKFLLYNRLLTYNNYLTHDRLPEQRRKVLIQTDYDINFGRTTMVAVAHGRDARKSNTMKVINPASLNFVSVYRGETNTGYVPVNLGRGSGFGVIQQYKAKTFMVYPNLRRTNYYPGYPVNFPYNSLVHENILTNNNSAIYNKSLLYNRLLTHNNYLTHDWLPEQRRKVLTQTDYDINFGRTTMVAVAHGRDARKSNTMKVINPASLNFVSLYSGKMSMGYVSFNLGRGSGFGIKDYAAKLLINHTNLQNHSREYLVNSPDNSRVSQNMLTHSKSLTNNFRHHKSSVSGFDLSIINRKKSTNAGTGSDYPMTELQHYNKHNHILGKEHRLRRELEEIEKSSRGGKTGTTGQTASPIIPVGMHKNVDANMITNPNSTVDVNRIAEQVYRVIERKVRIERERRGM